MNKLLVILGPTAIGKTDLAIKVAKKFGGELVSCDSRQVYKELDIGAGKITNNQLPITKGDGFWDVGKIRIWMFDVLDPKKQYTVADYVKDAERIIKDVMRRGKLPIIVGGTGLYLKALLEGLDNLAIKVDPVLREKLNKSSLKELQEKLLRLSVKRWEGMNYSDRHNPRRLVRAIELETVGKNREIRGIGGLERRYGILKVGLTAKREDLYKRTDKSVFRRIEQGIVEEAARLHKRGLSLERMKQLGLEYGVLADYLSGTIRDMRGNQGLIKIMQGKIHGYVRRQLTWFKNPSTSSGYIHWFDIGDRNFLRNVEKLIYQWYHQADDQPKN